MAEDFRYTPVRIRINGGGEHLSFAKSVLEQLDKLRKNMGVSFLSKTITLDDNSRIFMQSNGFGINRLTIDSGGGGGKEQLFLFLLPSENGSISPTMLSWDLMSTKKGVIISKKAINRYKQIRHKIVSQIFSDSVSNIIGQLSGDLWIQSNKNLTKFGITYHRYSNTPVFTSGVFDVVAMNYATFGFIPDDKGKDGFSKIGMPMDYSDPKNTLWFFQMLGYDWFVGGRHNYTVDSKGKLILKNLLVAKKGDNVSLMSYDDSKGFPGVLIKIRGFDYTSSNQTIDNSSTVNANIIHTDISSTRPLGGTAGYTESVTFESITRDNNKNEVLAANYVALIGDVPLYIKTNSKSNSNYSVVANKVGVKIYSGSWTAQNLTRPGTATHKLDATYDYYIGTGSKEINANSIHVLCFGSSPIDSFVSTYIESGTIIDAMSLMCRVSNYRDTIDSSSGSHLWDNWSPWKGSEATSLSGSGVSVSNTYTSVSDYPKVLSYDNYGNDVFALICSVDHNESTTTNTYSAPVNYVVNQIGSGSWETFPDGWEQYGITGSSITNLIMRTDYYMYIYNKGIVEKKLLMNGYIQQRTPQSYTITGNILINPSVFMTKGYVSYSYKIANITNNSIGTGMFDYKDSLKFAKRVIGIVDLKTGIKTEKELKLSDFKDKNGNIVNVDLIVDAAVGLGIVNVAA